MKRQHKRIVLQREIIRSLTEQQLGRAAGGMPVTSATDELLKSCCYSCLPSCTSCLQGCPP